MTTKSTARVKSTYARSVSDLGEIFNEKIQKVNDYSIALIVEDKMADAYVSSKKTFNFAMAEIEEVIVARSDKGVSVTKSKTLFKDLSSIFEISLMYEELEKMGGNPPELQYIVPERFIKRPRPVVEGFIRYPKKVHK